MSSHVLMEVVLANKEANSLQEIMTQWYFIMS